MIEQKDLKQIEHIAKLANLNLSKAELKKFAQQISQVIEFNISHLQRIDTKNVDPTSHFLGAKNSMRMDETRPGLSTKEALQNASETDKNFFKVKAVLSLPENKSGGG